MNGYVRTNPINIDVKEVLKNDMAYERSILYPEKNRPDPRCPHGTSDQYVILDSFNKVESSNIYMGEYKWNFSIQGSTDQEVVGVRDKIDTVIEIQIGSFTIPNLQEVPYILAPVPITFPSGLDQLILVHNNINVLSPQLLSTQYPAIIPSASTPFSPWISNPYSQLPFSQLTIQIRDAGLQSISDKYGARHHFDCSVSSTENPNLLKVSPISDTFIFTDPLKDIHGITLVFRNPDHPITFLPDCMDSLLESDGSAFPGPYLRVNAPGHSLLVGDRIFMSGCRSGNASLDRYINRREGHVAASSPGLILPTSTPIPTDYFYTDPAISIADLTVSIPVLPKRIMVCVAKRRIRIPMRMRRIVDRLTNYIVPT